jgi:cold shock CspA family protein
MFEPHVSEYFYGVMRKRAPAGRAGQLSGPRSFQGTRAAGRVVKLLIGQGHGFIRLANAREVFFHRSDMQEGTAFNDLQLGTDVTFELFEDVVSGARALRVARRRRSR